MGAIEPKFFANLCRLLGCEQWTAHQLDDDVQDKIRADFRAAFATKDRDAWVAELAGADTCVTPVLSVAELVDDEQFARPPRLRRGGRRPTGADRGGGRRPGSARWARCWPAWWRPTARWWPATRGRSDTDRLLAAAGLAPDRTSPSLRDKGVVA